VSSIALALAREVRSAARRRGRSAPGAATHARATVPAAAPPRPRQVEPAGRRGPALA